MRLKQMIMGTAEKRTAVHQMIDEIDNAFLDVVYAMLGTYTKQQEDAIIGYSINGDPMYASEAKKEFKRRFEAIDEGEFITLDELKKESATWLKGKAVTE